MEKFSANFRDLETSFEILKTHHIFDKYCLFLAYFLQNLVIFSPKKLSDHTKNV